MKAKRRSGSEIVEVWHNVDDGEPIPAWMNGVACWLPGGRFAIESPHGTRVAELGDWVVYWPSLDRAYPLQGPYFRAAWCLLEECDA